MIGRSRGTLDLGPDEVRAAGEAAAGEEAAGEAAEGEAATSVGLLAGEEDATSDEDEVESDEEDVAPDEEEEAELLFMLMMYL